VATVLIRCFLLFLLAIPAAVHAEELSAVDAAERAASTHEAWCSDVAAARSTTSFEASAAVSAVLAEVSRAYDRTPEVWLLYWRGLLAACAEREERAIDDLSAFAAAADGDPALADQVTDARRRLRRLMGGSPAPAPAPPPPAIAIGVGLFAGGAAFAGLSGWQASEVQRHQVGFEESELAWAARVTTWAEPGEQAAVASNALLGAAIGVGVGGVATMVLSSLVGGRVGVAVAPTEQGVAVVVGGTW
jgi:hypothetical protein